MLIHSPSALSSFQFKGEGGRELFGEELVSESLLTYQLLWNAEPSVHWPLEEAVGADVLWPDARGQLVCSSGWLCLALAHPQVVRGEPTGL